MEYLILIVCFFVLLHFVWEGIIAPSIRLKLRYQLFALRDELRGKQVVGTGCSAEAYNTVQNSINNAIAFMHQVDIVAVSAARRVIANDRQLRRDIEARREILQRYPEAERLYQESNKLVRLAFLVNSGGWFFYLVPIVLVYALFATVLSSLTAMFALPIAKLSQHMPRLKECAIS